MAIIGIVNQKGGCGKSTTAVHLAYWLQNKKKKNTILVDADAQRSSSKWIPNLEGDILCEVIQDPDTLLEKLPVLEQQCDILIVDAPGSLSEQTKSILFHADLAVLPIQPTGLDLGSTEDTFRLITLVRSVRKKDPVAVAFINRAIKGTNLLKETTEYLGAAKEINLLTQVIHQRQAIADTAPLNTVWGLNSKGASEAEKEFTNLFEEVLSCI